MSVEQEALNAARTVYPLDSDHLSAKGMRRVPYAQGYLAGYAAALESLPRCGHE